MSLARFIGFADGSADQAIGMDGIYDSDKVNEEYGVSQRAMNPFRCDRLAVAIEFPLKYGRIFETCVNARRGAYIEIAPPSQSGWRLLTLQPL